MTGPSIADERARSLTVAERNALDYAAYFLGVTKTRLPKCVDWDALRTAQEKVRVEGCPVTGPPADHVDPIEDAALPDPYVCQRCHRLYPYLDLMGQPECQCGSESFFYVPNGAEAAHVIHRNLALLASGGSGEVPARCPYNDPNCSCLKAPARELGGPICSD